MFFTYNVIAMRDPFFILILTYVCFFAGVQGQAQVKLTGVVMDTMTRKSIPFATLKVKHKPSGAYSNENGFYEIVLHQTDSLTISSIGYQTREISIAGVDTIWLTPEATILPDFVVSEESKKEICGIRERKYDMSLGSQIGAEYVLKISFPDTIRTFLLNNVILLTNKSIKNENLQLRIYDVSEDGGPGKQLLNEPVFITRKSLSDHTLELRDQYIAGRKQIFVGIELIGVKGEVIESSFRTRCTYSKEEPMTYMRTIQDPEYRWRKLSPNAFGNQNPPNLIISLEVQAIP